MAAHPASQALIETAIPAEKRRKTAIPMSHRGSNYEPESPTGRADALSQSLPRRRMRLPTSTLNAYTMLPEYQEICKCFRDEYVERGWELFRRLDFLDAFTSYPPEELRQGLTFLYHGILPLFEKIHREEIGKDRTERSGTEEDAVVSSFATSNNFEFTSEGFFANSSQNDISTFLDDDDAVDTTMAQSLLPLDLQNRMDRTPLVGIPSRQSTLRPATSLKNRAATRFQPGDQSTLKSRHNQDKYQCTYCHLRFSKEGNRDQHEKKIHDSKYTYTCTHEECNLRIFDSEDGFKKHHNKAHRSCFQCLTPQPTLVRPPKKAAACGDCGKMFRQSHSPSFLLDRSAHIHSHYANRTDDEIYTWKAVHWKRTKIVKAFLQQPEVSLAWLQYKASKESAPQGNLVYCWDQTEDQEWNRFVEVLEFGDFSEQHVQQIVQKAYDLALKQQPPKVAATRRFDAFQSPPRAISPLSLVITPQTYVAAAKSKSRTASPEPDTNESSHSSMDATLFEDFDLSELDTFGFIMDAEEPIDLTIRPAKAMRLPEPQPASAGNVEIAPTRQAQIEDSLDMFQYTEEVPVTIAPEELQGIGDMAAQRPTSRRNPSQSANTDPNRYVGAEYMTFDAPTRGSSGQLRRMPSKMDWDEAEKPKRGLWSRLTSVRAKK